MDCSTLMVNDAGGEVEKSYCPFCKRAFCVECMVPWHSHICRKFQKLKKKGENVMLKDLAKRKMWRRCPLCKNCVEESFGFFYMILAFCVFVFCSSFNTQKGLENSPYYHLIIAFSYFSLGWIFFFFGFVFIWVIGCQSMSLFSLRDYALNM
jgi:hypothetical protein